jgi:hypothetical protein
MPISSRHSSAGALSPEHRILYAKHVAGFRRDDPVRAGTGVPGRP